MTKKTKKSNKEIMAIIPARGGSKSIPRKNIVPLGGKPLIAWSIEAALGSKFITRTVVSSDDEEILKVAETHGAEVLRRPAELATDKATSEPVILHVLDHFLKHEKYEPDLVIYLQPTSPLRTTDDIDGAIRVFHQKEADALISVYEIDKSFLKSFLVDESGMLKGVSNNLFPFMNISPPWAKQVGANIYSKLHSKPASKTYFIRNCCKASKNI